MKRTGLNLWITIGLIAVLYALTMKTILTAWINPAGNEFTFKDFSLTIGEAVISTGSIYLSYRLTMGLFNRLSVGVQYGIIIAQSIIINGILFLLYWVFFARLFVYNLPTDVEAYAPEVMSRTWTLHFPVAIISIIFIYNKHAHNAQLQIMGMEKALAETQLKNLQQQVDPHFLFNSLNILAALIKIDADKSVLFTHNLAEIYRYFLKSKNEILINLKEEIEFVESYFYLVQVRFGKAFSLHIQNNSIINTTELYIIPGTIQLLVENVIKHNTANEEDTVRINILIEEERLTVVNRINKKENSSTGFGLTSLAVRYKHLNNKEVQYFEKGGQFHVHIPLIKNAA